MTLQEAKTRSTVAFETVGGPGKESLDVVAANRLRWRCIAAARSVLHRDRPARAASVGGIWLRAGLRATLQSVQLTG